MTGQQNGSETPSPEKQGHPIAPRPNWEEYFFLITAAVSSRASCDRATVGAIIVDPTTKRILSTGYNGAPSGHPDCETVGHDMVEGHCLRAIHAEENSIAYAAASGVAIKNAEMYVFFHRNNSEWGKKLAETTYPMTEFPCHPCWAMLMSVELSVVHVLTQSPKAGGGHTDIMVHFKR